MTGIVPYDDGHPLRQYTLAAYNLQFYSSAFILKSNDDPVFLYGFRSLLFNLSTVLPVFMLGAWTSLRTWVGHAAVLFILMGTHLEFDGVYPQFVWPGMFSNGHIGMGYVLIFAGALAAGHLRSAGLLLVLMPAIHLGQMPTAGLLAVCYAVRCMVQADFEPLKNAVRWFCVGVGFCLLFYLAQQQFVLPPVTEGAYYSESNVDSVWQGRISSGRDIHRSFSTGNIHLVTVATLIISLGGLWSLRRRESLLEAAWLWLSVYAHCVILIVYSIMALHSLILYGVSLTPIFLVILASAVFSVTCRFVFERHKSKSMPLLRQRTFFFVVVVILSSAVLAIVTIADGSVPYLLLGWLPYRLMNHLAPILLIMSVILVRDTATSPSKRSNVVPYLLAALLLFHLAKPLYPFVFGESFYSRYLFHNDSVFFVLVGAVATLHQFGAACFTAGAIGVYGLLRSPLTLSRADSRTALYALGARYGSNT